MANQPVFLADWVLLAQAWSGLSATPNTVKTSVFSTSQIFPAERSPISQKNWLQPVFFGLWKFWDLSRGVVSESAHAAGWFIRSMERAFANMDDGQLNHVSETLNHEMDQRVTEEAAPARPRGARSESRPGRDRSRPPPGGVQEEEEAANEPGSRARSRSKAVTRRRAQWRADHGSPEEEWAASAAAAAAEQEDEDDEVEIGQADFSTDSPPRRGGWQVATWRRGPEPVTQTSPAVARPGEGRLRVIGDDDPDLPKRSVRTKKCSDTF